MLRTFYNTYMHSKASGPDRISPTFSKKDAYIQSLWIRSYLPRILKEGYMHPKPPDQILAAPAFSSKELIYLYISLKHNELFETLRRAIKGQLDTLVFRKCECKLSMQRGLLVIGLSTSGYQDLTCLL